jgi:hypothetical protein
MTYVNRFGRLGLVAALAVMVATAALPASAQALDDPAFGAAAVGAPTASASPVSLATPAQSLARAGRSGVTKDVLRDLSSSANRDWKNHTMGREYKEDFDCPLSFAFAGELRGNGYKGLKLLGTTVPISKPADSTR